MVSRSLCSPFVAPAPEPGPPCNKQGSGRFELRQAGRWMRGSWFPSPRLRGEAGRGAGGRAAWQGLARSGGAFPGLRPPLALARKRPPTLPPPQAGEEIPTAIDTGSERRPLVGDVCMRQAPERGSRNAEPVLFSIFEIIPSIGLTPGLFAARQGGSRRTPRTLLAGAPARNARPWARTSRARHTCEPGSRCRQVAGTKR